MSARAARSPSTRRRTRASSGSGAMQGDYRRARTRGRRPRSESQANAQRDPAGPSEEPERADGLAEQGRAQVAHRAALVRVVEDVVGAQRDREVVAPVGRAPVAAAEAPEAAP